MLEQLSGAPEVSLVLGLVFLAVAGLYELKTYRVPNVLTLAAIVAALIFAAVAPMFAPDREGGLATAFIGMLAGGVIMIPFYANGILGAGCVKAQIAFGAWVGSGYSLAPCLKLVLVGSVVAGLFTFGWYFLNQKQVNEDQESGHFGLMHGQLPIAVGTLLGVVVVQMIQL